MNLEDLEAEVNKRWGPSVFEWQMGRSNDPAEWFWYCGSSAEYGERGGWAHGGHAATAKEALYALLEAGSPGHKCKRCEYLHSMSVLKARVEASES